MIYSCIYTDFSLFRIYVDKNNRSADYSVDNIPFTSKRSLEINIGGIKENDGIHNDGNEGSMGNDVALGSVLGLEPQAVTLGI